MFDMVLNTPKLFFSIKFSAKQWLHKLWSTLSFQEEQFKLRLVYNLIWRPHFKDLVMENKKQNLNNKGSEYEAIETLKTQYRKHKITSVSVVSQEKLLQFFISSSFFALKICFSNISRYQYFKNNPIIWVKVFKNRPSTFCGRQSLKYMQYWAEYCHG